MAKKNKLNSKQEEIAKATGENYAYKPMKIGPLIKQIVEERGFNEKYLAPKLDRYWRTIYRWYERTYLNIAEMMKASEVLGVNLFLLYHPNVKPLPDPTEPLRKEIEALKKENEELRNENGILKNRITRLDGQIDKLDEQVAEFMKRKG